MKLVDVEPILKKHREAPCWMSAEAAYGFESGMNSVLEELEDAPDVSTYAHWILKENGMGVCSNCNHLDNIDPLATHCRYCGAKIKE